MPRGFDHDIRKQVDMNVEQGDSSSYPKGRCVHCDKIIAVTASTIKRHLKGCTAYEKHRRDHPDLHPESTELTPRRTVNKAASAAATPSKTPKPPIIFPNPNAQARAAQIQAARAIYVDGLPFRVFSTPEMDELFHMLNAGYRSPTEDELCNELLDLVYDDYLKKVRAIIDSTPWVNIILDAAGSVRDEMTLIVCVNPAPGISYYWTRVDTGDIEITASNRLQLLRPVLADISGGNPNRIMSYTMSTEESTFSEPTFQFCPVRNRLPPHKLEKLRFVYHNHRVLKQRAKSFAQLTEGEIEEMENLLFQQN